MVHVPIVADGDVDPRVPVPPARFQQQYLVPRVFGQPAGHDAAGGSRPDDDVVVGLAHAPPALHGYTDRREQSRISGGRRRRVIETGLRGFAVNLLTRC